MRIRVFMCLAAASVSACSTISKETAYDGSPTGAFAVVVADGMVVNGSQSYSFGFQRIDLDKQAFLPDLYYVQFSGMPALEGNEFKKPDSLSTTLRFGGRAVLPGDYALIARTDLAAYGYSSSTQVNCFSKGTTVFRIRAGHVNLIDAGHVREAASADRVTLEKQAAVVLSAYPKISAPTAIAEPVGRVAFATGQKNFLGVEVCQGTAITSFSARGASAGAPAESSTAASRSSTAP
jgi:hypothetical protein